VGFAHRSDHPALNQLNDLAIILSGMDLNAHLGGDLGMGRRFANASRFPDVVGERLFTINMLAMFEGEHRGKSVRVLAGAHDDCVKFPGMIEDLPEIREFARRRVFRRSLVQVLRVHIA
jgi:hypothetical protein